MNKDWLYEEYVVKNKSRKEIAQEWGCKPSTITSWAHKHGLKKTPPPYKDKEILYEKYINEKKSCVKIAEELNCSDDTISYWLQVYRIEIRGKGLPLQINIESEQVFIEYIENKKSISQISKEYNTPRNHISHILNELGIQKYSLRDIQFLCKNKDIPKELFDKEWLINEYVNNNKSKSDLAKMLNVDPGTIEKSLKDFNIYIRNNSESKIGLWAGDKHPNWKGTSTINQLLRQYCKEYQYPTVLHRDNYKCKLCLSKKDLQIHHIIPFNIIINSIIAIHPEYNINLEEDRISLIKIIRNNNTFQDLDNLITVCFECHYNVIHASKKDNQQPSNLNNIN
jgi:hypothetical protein